jgi:hypothetical protein
MVTGKVSQGIFLKKPFGGAFLKPRNIYRGKFKNASDKYQNSSRVF